MFGTKGWNEESSREGELNQTAEQLELNTRAENIAYNHNQIIYSCSRSTTPITQTGAIHSAVARYSLEQAEQMSAREGAEPL